MASEEFAENYINSNALTYGNPGGLLRVWRFQDAPCPLRGLSEHGGDEDWLLLIPPGYSHFIGWAEEDWPSMFGANDISHHPLPNGWEVRIGAHS